MRIRTIKPEMLSHPILARLSDSSRFLAAAILCVADDEGYFHASPAFIRSQVWPFDDDSTRARRSIDDLSRIGFIQVRNNPTHGDVGWVVNFTKHQRVDRANKSKIRTYFDSTNDRRMIDDESTTEQGTGNREQGRDQGKEQGVQGDCAGARPNGLSGDQEPSSGVLTLTGEENASESQPEAKARPSKRFSPPTKDEADLHAAKIGLPPSEVARFLAYYESNGWRVGKNPMKSWHGAMTNWKLNYEQRTRSSGNLRNQHIAGFDSLREQHARLIESRKDEEPIFG